MEIQQGIYNEVSIKYLKGTQQMAFSTFFTDQFWTIKKKRRILPSLGQHLSKEDTIP